MEESHLIEDKVLYYNSISATRLEVR
jgi:hypothetical protein